MGWSQGRKASKLLLEPVRPPCRPAKPRNRTTPGGCRPAERCRRGGQRRVPVGVGSSQGHNKKWLKPRTYSGQNGSSQGQNLANGSSPGQNLAYLGFRVWVTTAQRSVAAGGGSVACRLGSVGSGRGDVCPVKWPWCGRWVSVCVCVCVCVCLFVRVCARARQRERGREGECVCVCERERCKPPALRWRLGPWSMPHSKPP